MLKKNTYIISLGGSLVVTPEGIDWKLLKGFRSLILEEVRKGKRFFIIVGGGVTCRKYNEAARKTAKVSQTELDWLGIYSGRLNARLLKTIFGPIAYPEIITDPIAPLSAKNKIIIGSGWKPGWSTDYVATVMAREHKAKTVINLSNIDYVYTADPRKYKNAKPIKEMNWQNFRKLVGNKWNPGLNAPFDPVASRLAQKLGLEVIIMDGKKLGNLKNYLGGKQFKGTVIKN
ncbi:MAG: UMP kinase [Patescibacteria group bacterium]|nr:UMP kinase [Patescibacteria group bacterium]MDD5295231.1 UMP kinase [Patescibacteria group bacterium]MDD5554659.1 UMP kinase [Patescibacteria group bacterium]